MVVGSAVEDSGVEVMAVEVDVVDSEVEMPRRTKRL